MALEEMIQTITSASVTGVIIAYFIYRDLTFMNRLEESLSVLQKTVELLMKKKEGNENED